MNAAPHADGSQAAVAQTWRELRRINEEVARLSSLNLPSSDYFDRFLRLVLHALVAPAGRVWQCDVGLEPRILCRVDLPGQEFAADACATPLRTQVAQTGCPASLRLDGGDAVLVSPVLADQAVVALVEVHLGSGRSPSALPALLQFLAHLCDLASVYLFRRKYQADDLCQQRWQELEAFAQRIHSSLDLTEVAYQVANEGRCLADADRLSVAVRPGRNTRIEAVSGVEAVEPRSRQIRLLRRLCDQVLDWGEPLVFDGRRDESLPPALLGKLDAYLDESLSKLLVILPLREQRRRPQPPRAALVLECFAPTLPAEQMLARLEVLGRHTTSALAHAISYRRIPLRFLWGPLARVQAGLGGKRRAALAAAAVAAAALVAALVFVPYPLKMEARGQLLPELRRWVYAPVEGQVVRFEEGVEPGRRVHEGQLLVLLHDVQLETRVVQLSQEVSAAQGDLDALAKQLTAATTEEMRLRLSADRQQKFALRTRKFLEHKALRERTNSDPSRPGSFWLRSPLAGTVLNWDFRETFTNRLVRPTEPLLRLGDKSRAWEIELKIPQKNVGQVSQAFAAPGAPAELDVDLLVISAPTRTFKGKLSRTGLAAEAVPPHDDDPDVAPVVFASVRIAGKDIDPAAQIPAELLVAGTEVHARIRCGDHALGYSLFYGVWEFFYERVAFSF